MGYAFISYSSNNQREADSINSFLKEHNVQTWMAPYNIRPGSQWAGEINNGIRNCSCFILVLTESTQKSKQVYREVDLAVDLGKPIIPINLDQCKLNDTFEYYLHSQHMVMVSNMDFRNPVFSQILETVKLWTNSGNQLQSATNPIQFHNSRGVSLIRDKLLEAAKINIENGKSYLAEEEYKRAFKLGATSAAHALGNLYSKMREVNQAIYWFETGYRIGNLDERISCAASLMMLYIFPVNDKKKSEYWLERGKELEKLRDNQSD